MTESLQKYLENVRPKVDADVATMSAIFALYGLHKQYGAVRTQDGKVCFNLPPDNILLALYDYVRENDSIYKELTELHSALAAIPFPELESHYADCLEFLFDRDASSAGKQRVESYTAREITELLASIVNGEGYHSVFDPFCGSASMARMINPGGNLRYCGQELSIKTALLARINLDIAVGYSHGIRQADSIREWNDDKFDAVVTCPPINMKIPRDILESASLGLPRRCNSLDELIITRALHINDAKMVALMEGTGFCFKGGADQEFRKHLVEDNLLDTVIALPAGLLYGTSISSAIVICRSDREEGAPVRFVDAGSLFIRNRNNVRLDVQRVIAAIDSMDPAFCALSDVSMIVENDYNIVPSIYISADVVAGEGQTVVRLSSLLTKISGERSADRLDSDYVSPHLFRTELIDILLHKDKVSSSQEPENVSFKYYHTTGRESYLLVEERLGVSRFALRTASKDFRCYPSCQVYRINESLVTPEYLVHLVCGDNLIKTGRILLSNSMYRRFAIDSLDVQASRIDGILREYDEQVKESQEADARRLGIKRNISDLEHMLGSTQLRIDDIIATLEDIRPDDESYLKTVKSLKDNVEYMNRMIKFNNASISGDTFNLREQSLTSFIEGYADAWRNYGGGYFTLDTVNELPQGVIQSFDKVMMTVMLDSILSNAVRHSFHKRKNYTRDNRVEIRLSQVEHEGKPFVLLQVSNNGDPISEGFTLKDYISRGRHTAATGRSGLGGYHVYRIAKGHGGYLYLDSSKIWNFIVEVLLPLPGETDENMEEYANECI